MRRWWHHAHRQQTVPRALKVLGYTLGSRSATIVTYIRRVERPSYCAGLKEEHGPSLQKRFGNNAIPLPWSRQDGGRRAMIISSGAISKTV